MKNYLISYDLTNKNYNTYQNLYNKLNELNAMRVLESAWLVRYSCTSAELKDFFDPFFKSNDHYIITESTSNGYFNVHGEYMNNFSKFYNT